MFYIRIECSVSVVQHLNIQGWFENSLLLKLLLIMWMVSAILVMFLLGQIDSIVHGDLYGYGLEFSIDWAGPYWAYANLIYVFLIFPMIVGGGILLIGSLIKYTGYDTETRVSARREVKRPKVKTEALKQNNIAISCPQCKKVFGKPLNMLDFSGGKPRLANVCPYCNHILPDKDEKDSKDVRLADMDEEVVH